MVNWPLKICGFFVFFAMNLCSISCVLHPICVWKDCYTWRAWYSRIENLSLSSHLRNSAATPQTENWEAVPLPGRPKHRAWVHGGQMAHHPVSLCTKLDWSCPSVLQPYPQEIKARWNLSEWSPTLAHSSWGDGGKSKPPPWSLSEVGRNTYAQTRTGANTYLLMFTQGHKLTVDRCCQLCGNAA